MVSEGQAHRLPGVPDLRVAVALPAGAPYYKDFEAKTTAQIALLLPGRHSPMSGGDHPDPGPDVKGSIDSSDQYLSACEVSSGSGRVTRSECAREGFLRFGISTAI